MEAARADLVANLVRPALAAGRVVLCDRYDDSTLAYQGAGRGLDSGLLAMLNQAATGGLEPDLTLLYDVPPKVGLARRESAAGGTNRLDREPTDFHLRVRRCFLELAATEPQRWVVLDATATPDELERLGWAALEQRLAAER
jgi:dTMP kinase